MTIFRHIFITTAILLFQAICIINLMQAEVLNIELGRGVDQKRQRVSKYKCIDGEVVSSGASYSSLDVNYLENVNTVNTLISISEGVAVDLILLGGSVSASIKIEQRISSNSLVFHFKTVIKASWSRLRNKKVSQEYKDEVSRIRSQALRTVYCGDSYIAAIQRGFIIINKIIFEFKSEEDLKEFQTSVTANIGPFSKTKTNTIISNNKKIDWNLIVSTNQIGGDREKFIKFKKEVDLGCNSSDLSKCYLLMDKLFDYSTDMQNINAQLSDTIASNILQVYYSPIVSEFPEIEVEQFFLDDKTKNKIEKYKAEIEEILMNDGDEEFNDQKISRIYELETNIKQCIFNNK